MSYTPTFMFKNDIDYAAIPKEYLRDQKLSIKAKGLLTIIYTLPNEWDYNYKGLMKISNLSEKTLRKLLNELEEEGYIFRQRQRRKNGQYFYEYIIFPTKQNFDELSNWFLMH